MILHKIPLADDHLAAADYFSGHRASRLCRCSPVEEKPGVWLHNVLTVSPAETGSQPTWT